MFKGKTLYKVHNKRIHICISFLLNHVLSYTLSNFSVCGWPKCPEKWLILEHTFYVGIFSCCVLNFAFLKKKTTYFLYSKNWRILLEHFVKHKPWNWEEWTWYTNMWFRNSIKNFRTHFDEMQSIIQDSKVHQSFPQVTFLFYLVVQLRPNLL